MMKTTVITLTIGSTANCLTRTNAPTNTAFIVVGSTVPIIVPFGIFMARLTDISQPLNTTIRGLITTAMAIGVIDSVSDWGSLRPRRDNLAILNCGLRQGKELECPG